MIQLSYKLCSYVRIWTDGASQQNKMGLGVVIRPGTQPIVYKEIYGLIEPVENTKNHFVAEWASIVVALNLCTTIPGLKRIDLFNDNEIVVNQMNGKARIRKIHLAKLHAEAVRLIHTLKDQGVEKFNFHHVRKRHNNYADSLSQKAIEGEEVMLDIWKPLDPFESDTVLYPSTLPPDTHESEQTISPPVSPSIDPPVPISLPPDTLEDKGSRAEQIELMKDFIKEKKALKEQPDDEVVDDGPGFVASTTLDDMEPDLTEDSSLEELEAEQQRIQDLIGDKRVEEAVNVGDLRVQEKKKKEKGFAGLKL